MVDTLLYKVVIMSPSASTRILGTVWIQTLPCVFNTRYDERRQVTHARQTIIALQLNHLTDDAIGECVALRAVLRQAYQRLYGRDIDPVVLM